MARHSGKNGKVKMGTDFVAALTGWDIDEQAETHDTTSMGDTSDNHVVGFSSWSGSIKMNADHGSDGQDVRAGDELAFEGYSEGDGAGKTYYSGNISVTGLKLQTEVKGTVTREYSFQGNGDLTVATVGV